MSKGNMLLGHARGKVGSLVFSRANGKQIVRARADVVKNPQTEKQMIQRIIMATVAQAYSRFAAICDHSFEGLQAGQESMSYFVSKNLKNIRDRIAAGVAAQQSLDDIYAFVPVGSNIYAPNEYILSKGQLPSIVPTFVGTTKAKITGLAVNTYKAVLDAYGLQRGDQITLIATQGLRPDTTIFHYARIILDPMNVNGTPADIESEFITNGAVNLPNPRNEGVFNSIAFNANAVEYNFSAQNVSGAAVIVSRQKSDGSWARSNSTMVLNEAGAGAMFSLQACLDMVANGDINTLSSMYLNNAGTGNIAGVNDNPYSGVRISDLTIAGTARSVGYRIPTDSPGNEMAVAFNVSGLPAGTYNLVKCNGNEEFANPTQVKAVTGDGAVSLTIDPDMGEVSTYYLIAGTAADPVEIVAVFGCGQ